MSRKMKALINVLLFLKVIRNTNDGGRNLILWNPLTWLAILIAALCVAMYSFFQTFFQTIKDSIEV